MNLATTQLKDTYGNLVTTGTSEGSPTEGGLQNGQGALLTSVGIGTNTPAVALDVVGNLQTTGYLSVEGTSGNTGAGTDRWIGGDGTAGTWFYNVPTGSNHYFAVNNTNTLSIDSAGIDVTGTATITGNVGIGTTNPATNLHIEDSSGATLRLTTPASGGTSTIQALGYDSANVNRFSSAIDFQSVAGSSTANGHIIFSTYPSNSKTERMRIDSSGNVGIGSSDPSDRLEVKGATAKGVLVLSSGDTTITGNDVIGQINFKDYDADAHAGGNQNDLVSIKAIALHESGGATALDGSTGEGYALSFSTSKRPSPNALFTVSEAMRIDSSGNVGISTGSPQAILNNFSTSARGIAIENGYPMIALSDTANSSFKSYIGTDSGELYVWNSATGPSVFATNNTERMRIDSSGTVLVGTDSDAGTSAGHVLFSNGASYQVRDGGFTALHKRLTSDGEILRFYKDATQVGSIGSVLEDSLSRLYIAQSDTGLKFNNGPDYIVPCTSAGADRDNVIDLGSSSARFTDIYATNGTIQTSDINEKQDIEELNDAELRVAQQAKTLLRKFRWTSSVEEKGDDARIHFGIIAQDLEQAFTDEGLDAGRYGMFIKSTWTNEDGEEQTRLGVRYNQLLAFIISSI